MRHDSFTGRGSQHIGTQTDNTARRHIELKVHTLAGAFHFHHFTFTAGYHIDNLAGILFGNVDRELLDRLVLHAVYLLEDNLRLAYLQLISLAAHRLNQHGKVKHATTGHHPFSVFLALAYAKRKVLVQLLHQTVMYMAGSYKLTFFSEERRVVDSKQHTHGRLVNGDGRQCFGVLVVANRISDFKPFDTH